MPTRSFAILIIFITLLASPLATQAASREGSSGLAKAAPASKTLFLRAWEFLANRWTKEGCNIDPNGRCVSAPVRVSRDEGCNIDPDGRCRS